MIFIEDSMLIVVESAYYFCFCNKENVYIKQILKLY